MAKRKLCAGIVIGSIVGGLIALADPKVRRYAKEKAWDLRSKTVQVIKNPSETTERIKNTFNQFNEKITNSAEWAIQTLETIEESINTLSKK